MRCTSVITEWYKNNWSNNDAVNHCAIDRMRTVFLGHNFTNGNDYRLCIAHRVCYYGLTKSLCVHIFIIIMCKCQDVLMLLKFLYAFPEWFFSPLTAYHNVFSFISGCWCGTLVFTRSTFNIKLILRIILLDFHMTSFIWQCELIDFNCSYD